MKSRRAFTLLELLISIGLMAVVTYGCVEVMSIGLGYNEHLRSSHATDLDRMAFEEKITNLIHHIYIDPVNQTNPSVYLVGQSGNGVPVGQTVQPGEVVAAPGTPGATGTTTGTTAGGATTAPSTTGSNSGDSDTLFFTTIGVRVPDSVLASADDFETNNTNFGPQGGIGEYELDMVPVGDSQGQTGLILRQQNPADQDATQGGHETVIEPDVTQISFEFFDGNQWQPSWNTFSQTTRHLPNAIRIDYTLKGETQDRILIVQIPTSTVSVTNPATMTGGS